jgi:hypothetical protein
VVPDQALPAVAAVVSPLVLAFLEDLEVVLVGDLDRVLGLDRGLGLVPVPVLERARERERVGGKSDFALIWIWAVWISSHTSGVYISEEME